MSVKSSYLHSCLKHTLWKEKVSVHLWLEFLFARFKYINSIVKHSGSLVLKLTCTSSTHRRGLNPPHRVKSISMTTFTHQEIEFLQKHSNEVKMHTLQQSTSFIVKHYFLESWLSGFDLDVAHLGIFWTLHSQLYWHSSLPTPPPPYFWSSPPPFPSLYFLSPLSWLCHHPHPNPLLTSHSPHSSSCPPCRSVNTSGWASMTTGHQLFQISENHRK